MRHGARVSRPASTLAAVALGALVLVERLNPLRARTARRPRLATNLALGAGCMVVIALVESPLARAVAERNARRRLGLAQVAPRPMRGLVGLLAMDYGFYVWHVLTHKLPMLWRFHRVHHVDPDLDSSTGPRFHPLDMLISLPFRLLQVRLAGVDRRGLERWRTFFNASVLFHHSNLRLPGAWDRRLAWVLTTPAMHGIHHAQDKAQRDSNWSSGFSFWDRLHGTFRHHRQPAIGVDDPVAARDVPLVPALAAPFRPLPSESAPR